MPRQLFVEDSNYKTNAQVDIYDNYSDSDAELSYWSMYAEGFKGLAEVGVERVLQNSSRRDALVYPIISNYRHYIELRLKEIIISGNPELREANRLSSEQLKKLFQSRSGHNLIVLWGHFRRIAETICPDGPKSRLDAIEKLIRQFSEVDPFGMAARYPVDTDGNRSFVGKVAVVGIRV